MGNSGAKDQHVDIFIETSNPYYVAGEYLEGYVYINAKKDRKYNNLILYLIGDEHVEKGKTKKNDRKAQRNRYENYRSFFLMNDFKGTLPMGQYAFPFAILLPYMMSGSFYYSEACFIKYSLMIELTNALEPKHTQSFSIYVNIIEPPRMPLLPSKVC